MADDGLSPDHFARVDESADTAFYALPRMVAHIDDAARAALTGYFAAHLPAGGRIFDMMSSCISHLPETVGYGLVVGLGLNAAELAANPRLDGALVQDVNALARLPFRDAAFDACILSVSVQYLTSPVEVFAEIGRALAPGARCHVSFSNRMFPTKAIAAWRAAGDRDHARLVGHYFVQAGLFEAPHLEDLSPAPGRAGPLFVVSARRRLSPHSSQPRITP